jgi:hypothetical protein
MDIEKVGGGERPKMRSLHFQFRGEHYEVDEHGRIKVNGLREFSDSWIFLGGAKHHWCNRITISLSDAFKNPSDLNGCLGFDEDHGTRRQWGGSYCGKLPRISNAYVKGADK